MSSSVMDSDEGTSEVEPMSIATPVPTGCNTSVLVLATLRPADSAHMLLPLPMCTTSVRPAAALLSNCASTLAMYSYESP